MRYRKISVQIWNDEKFRQLSDDGKLAFLFVLTHPHMTSIGAMRATIEGLSAELGWTPKRLRDAIALPKLWHRLEFDEGAMCLWLTRFLDHNPPTSRNCVKSWVSAFELVPECSLKSLIAQALNERNKSLTDGIRLAYVWQADAKRNQEQEQKQEQNKKKGRRAERSADPLEPWRPLPEGFDSPAAERALLEWIKHRKELRKTLTPSTIARQKKFLAGLGASLAHQSIEMSITNGWTGLFDPREKGNGRRNEQAAPYIPGAD